MNVYDFDKTIYAGYSMVDFYLFCLKRQPLLIKYGIIYLYNELKLKRRKITVTNAKEGFFKFLNHLEEIDKLILEFWEKHEKKIKEFYKPIQQENDLVISAAPKFLLEPICKKFNIKNLIASEVDRQTGKFIEDNTFCFGVEKVKYFNLQFPFEEIECFFSDSKTDTPLALLAEQAFLVKNNKISKWEF